MPNVGRFEELLDRYADHLRAVRNLAPATVHAEINALRAFFAWLVVEELTVADPSATLAPPRHTPNRVDVYSPEKMAAFTTEWDGSPRAALQRQSTTAR